MLALLLRFELCWFDMGYFEREPTIEPGRIAVNRRYAIGAQVIAIGVMRSIDDFISLPGNEIILENDFDMAAKKFFKVTNQDGYRASRRGLTENIRVDGNGHIARQQMNLASKTLVDSSGNKHFKPNSNFVIATHYLEDELYRAKLNAEIGIADILEPERQSFVDFYSERALTQLIHFGTKTDLREAINRSSHDAEYWLSEPI